MGQNFTVLVGDAGANDKMVFSVIPADRGNQVASDITVLHTNKIQGYTASSQETDSGDYFNVTLSLVVHKPSPSDPLSQNLKAIQSGDDFHQSTADLLNQYKLLGSQVQEIEAPPKKDLPQLSETT
jgi:hypothetical protein